MASGSRVTRSGLLTGRERAPESVCQGRPRLVDDRPRIDAVGVGGEERRLRVEDIDEAPPRPDTAPRRAAAGSLWGT
jgi:hypothetical protein